MKKDQNNNCVRFIYYTIGLPFLLPWLIYRLALHLQKISAAGDVAITCPSCGTSIPLVGIWRCQCGYTFRGHLLTSCPVCHTLPILVRCPRCQVTRKLL